MGRARLAKLPELERGGVMSSVVGARILSNLEHLERAVATDPKPWTTGADSANRRSIITDPVEAATQTAGELAALLAGERDVAMAQLWAGWLAPTRSPSNTRGRRRWCVDARRATRLAWR